MFNTTVKSQPPKRSSFAFKACGALFLVSLLFAKVAFGQTLYDSFSDGNFTASPVWGGSTGEYTIVASSDAAAGATGSQTVRLNAPATGATRFLSSQIATWGDNQTWRFFIGRRAQAFTASNQAYFWLYANEATLNNATVDGYRIAIGNDVTPDNIRLEYIVNGAVSTTVIGTSATPIPNLTDIGLLVRVTRTAAGVWTIFTSTVPTVNGTGAIATDIPSDANTAVNQGSATNNSLVPASNGFIGFGNLHTTGASAIVSTEWDQIYFDQSSAGGPTLTWSPTSFSSFTATAPAAGTPYTSATIAGSALSPASGNVTITAPTNFQVFNGTSWVTSYNIAYTGGALSATTVQMRVAASTPAGPVSGTFTATGGTAPTANFAGSGTVVGPLITVTGGSPFNKFHANFGQVSDGQLLTVSGSDLGADDITVGPFTGYEFSTDINFSTVSSSIVLSPVAGTVPPTPVYMRMAVAAPGNYNGTLNITSPNAATVTRSVTGQRYVAPVPFTAGNLIALRLGDGTIALSNAAQPVFLDEYTPGGTLVQSVAMPMTNDGTNRRFCISGTSVSDGVMNLSPDGKFLTLSGYNATNIYQAGITGTTLPEVQRLVATVDFAGNINTSTRLNAYSGNNIRGAVTVNGTGFWTTGPGGAGGSISYVPGGNDGTGVVNLNSTWNSRSVKISNSSLYVSRQAEIGRVAGPPLPTLAGTGTPTTIIGGLADCYNFVVLDVDPGVSGDDLIYLSDVDAGVRKFSFNGTSWVAQGTRPGGLPVDQNTSSITANVIAPGNIELYINHGVNTAGNTIYKIVDNAAYNAPITDNGVNYSLAPNLVATAGTNTIFRSVAFAPIFVPTPEIEHTFTTPGGVGNIAQGATTTALVRAQLDITEANALLTGATFTTAGAYAASDFLNFRLVLSNDGVLDAGDITLGTINSVGGPGQVLNFTGLGQLLPINTTRYLFLAPTVNGCAATFATINVGTVTTANISYGDLSTISTGSSFATETKTITVGLPNDVSGFTINQNIQVFFNPPVGCFTEVVVVAHTAPITGTPTGTYTGNLTYPFGAAFPGGGRVVYVGAASPQLISGLTVGTNYFIKVFVREGTRYSPGVESSVVHQREFLYSRGSGLSHTDAIWSLSPTGTPQTLTAIGGMQQFRGIRIQNGHSVQLSASGVSVVARELIVDAGGTFTATGTGPGDNKFLIVYGNISNNGTIGTGSTFNPICFSIEGATTTIAGSGVTNVSRIRKGDISVAPISNLIINKNVNVRFPDLGGVWVNVGGGRLNVTVNALRTLNITDPAGSFSIDGIDGTGSGERHGNVIVNGNLVVAGTLYIKNNNTTPGNNVNYSVGSAGVIDANNVIADFSPAGFNPSFLNFTAGGRLFVRGALTVQTGTLSSGTGGLVLKSTATGTGRVAPLLGGASISGDVTLERYVPNKGWHFIGHAVTSGQTLAGWNDDINTQGPMPGTKIFNPGANTSSIFAYDDFQPTIASPEINGWYVPTTPGVDFQRGYRVSFGAAPVTIDNTGPIANGTVTTNLSYTGASAYAGWNLISNPHPAPINWDAVTLTNTNPALITFNPATNKYQVYLTSGAYGPAGYPTTNTVINAAGNIVASNQAFFVIANGPGASVGFPQSSKANSPGTFYRTSSQTENTLRIKLSDRRTADEAIVRFIEGASEAYDLGFDADKLSNPDFTVFTASQPERKLAINSLASVRGTEIVPVIVQTSQRGSFTLSFSELESFTNGTHIYLKDNYLGTVEPVNATSVHEFNVTNDPATHATRFELIFSNNSGVTSIPDLFKNSIKLYPNPAEGSNGVRLVLNGYANEKVKVEISDLQGRLISASEIEVTLSVETTQLKGTDKLAAGTYLVNITSSKGTKAEKLVIR